MQTDQEVISLTKAAQMIPSRPSTASVWRWCVKGVRKRKLDSTIVGGRRYTTERAVAEFLKSLNLEAADELKADGC
jgi:hypothetical protein